MTHSGLLPGFTSPKSLVQVRTPTRSPDTAHIPRAIAFALALRPRIFPKRSHRANSRLTAARHHLQVAASKDKMPLYSTQYRGFSPKLCILSVLYTVMCSVLEIEIFLARWFYKTQIVAALFSHSVGPFRHHVV